MGWFEDAKQKASDTADDAKKKAAEEAGKAALSAATATAGRAIGSFFDTIASSAEASLESAQEARGLDDNEDSDNEDSDDEASESSESASEAEPEEEVSASEAALHELRRLKANEPEPAPRVTDPMDKALAALAKAREARGVTDEPISYDPVPSRPKSVDEVLAEAAAARAMVSRGGRAAVAREEAAMEQLAALKAARGGAVTRSPGSADLDDTPPSPDNPKKRTL